MDIPAIFLALKDKDTSIIAKVFAGIKFIPQDVLERNRKQAEGMWQDGKPKKWYYAIPIVIIWIIIIGVILKAIFGGSL